MGKEIWVASKNPVKISAAGKAFQRVFPEVDFELIGVPADSGVPDQPNGLDETLEGAMNRVSNLRELPGSPDFYVGMEGGIYRFNEDWFAFAWMYVESKAGLSGKAMTGFFPLPKEVILLLDKGLELGHAMDQVFSKQNSKQKGGAVGLLTKGLINRTDYYVHALVLALIPFLQTK